MTEKLTEEQDKKAYALWKKARNTIKHYEIYLENKPDRFHLAFIDLLFASNFKAGNGNIQEPLVELAKKLEKYSNLLLEVHTHFNERSLGILSNEELKQLLKYINLMISNCIDYKIDGFGVSYCSALFHFHFPKLIPVLDRRVLIGISIVTKAEQMTSEGQVRDIENHYTDLIEKLRHELISGRFADLDKADEHYFKMKIPVYLRRNALKNLHEKIS